MADPPVTSAPIQLPEHPAVPTQIPTPLAVIKTTEFPFEVVRWKVKVPVIEAPGTLIVIGLSVVMRNDPEPKSTVTVGLPMLN
jgi:hypothetical protein